MNGTRWTFETLAQANRATLEEVLVHSQAPNPQHLDGLTYNGYNHDWLGQLPGKKFRKAFFQEEEDYFGVNQVVVQDGQDFRGEWHVQTKAGKPVTRGFFHVLPAREKPLAGDLEKYRHLLFFDYDVGLNPAWNFLMRAIRDFVGLPNEEYYGVLLGKAYLRVLPGVNTFATYFVLEQRESFGVA